MSGGEKKKTQAFFPLFNFVYRTQLKIVKVGKEQNHLIRNLS